MICAFVVAYMNRDAAALSLWVALIGILAVAALSTFLFEKPLARRLRERYAERTAATRSVIARPSSTAERANLL